MKESHPGDSSADRVGAVAPDDRAGWPRPLTPRVSARWMLGLHRFVAPNAVWRALAKLLRKSPLLHRPFVAVESTVKGQMFGCQMCGQCALPVTAYACPQTCPKQLRNGPCGGVSVDGRCEVYPEERCVWVVAYQRADATGHVDDLRRLVRPIDHRRWGSSAWVSYWLGEDDLVWPKGDVIELRPVPVRSLVSANGASVAHDR